MNLDLKSLLIGGGITLAGTFFAHYLQAKREQRRQQEILTGVLQAIHDEIETLWNRYMEGMGSHLEDLPPGEALLLIYPITQGYFTAYTANASLIGQIKSSDIRQAIVNTYTKGRALIDSYRFNNELYKTYLNWTTIYAQTRLSVHQRFLNDSLQALIAYADTLKRLHQDTKQEVTSLLRLLEMTHDVVVTSQT